MKAWTIPPVMNISPGGIHEWRVDWRFHRTDGPARIYPDGHREWWVNGKRHREDGPAIEFSSGARTWFVSDKLHRLDGPAIQHPDGFHDWYVDGNQYEFPEEFQQAACLSDEEIVVLILKYGR